MTSFGDSILLWLGVYWLHSTLFLGAVWLVERLCRNAPPALLSAMWRTALLAGVASATLQCAGLVTPVVGKLAVMPASEDLAKAPILAAPSSPIETVAPSQPAAVELRSPSAAPVRPDQSRPVANASPRGKFDVGLVSSVLLWVWVGAASLLILRGGLTWWSAHRELRGRRPVVQGPLFERIQAMAQDIGLRRLPQVSFSEHIAGPFTLPSGEICIPVWARERLPQQQLDAMLAHEMAHVLHRDSLWLAIGMAVGTLFFFQPFNALARRRMANLAELSADDWAATRAGSGRPLAECISTFVDIAHSRARAMTAPEFAAAMAKPRSELVRRVERLLDDRYTSGVLPMKTRVLVAACALGFSFLVPGLSAQAHVPPAVKSPAASERGLAGTAAVQEPESPDIARALELEPARDRAPALDPAPAPQPQRHVSISRNNGELSMNIVSNGADYQLTASARGEIDLPPDGSGVARLSSGGFLDAALASGGQSRRVRYTGVGGDIRREFWVGGKARAWDRDADAFVAELMPILFRETGINAAERVDWLLQKRGEDALLSEIALIGSDSIQRIYANLYADRARLSTQRLERLLEIVGRQIDSDSELRLTLTKIYETQKPTGLSLAGLLRAASTIGSDSETRLVLTKIDDVALGSDAVADAYLDIAESIGSDSEMRLALWDAVSTPGISDARLPQAIAMAGARIDSDSELRLLLSHATGRVGASDALATAYIEAVRTIDSSSERRLALLALASDARLGVGSWRMFLDATKDIDSSSEKRLVLTGVASKLPRQDDVLSAYRSVTETIGSKSERRLAELALD